MVCTLLCEHVAALAETRPLDEFHMSMLRNSVAAVRALAFENAIAAMTIAVCALRAGAPGGALLFVHPCVTLAWVDFCVGRVAMFAYSCLSPHSTIAVVAKALLL